MPWGQSMFAAGPLAGVEGFRLFRYIVRSGQKLGGQSRVDDPGPHRANDAAPSILGLGAPGSNRDFLTCMGGCPTFRPTPIRRFRAAFLSFVGLESGPSCLSSPLTPVELAGALNPPHVRTSFLQEDSAPDSDSGQEQSDRKTAYLHQTCCLDVYLPFPYMW